MQVSGSIQDDNIHRGPSSYFLLVFMESFLSLEHGVCALL